ncbi:hypothetical protein VTH82DRAFT_446 [Thermothelomyces myriococcoides]
MKKEDLGPLISPTELWPSRSGVTPGSSLTADEAHEDLGSDESSFSWLFSSSKDEEEEEGRQENKRPHATADSAISRALHEGGSGSEEVEKAEPSSPFFEDMNPESPPLMVREKPDPGEGNAEEAREYVGIGLAPPVVFPLKRRKLPVFQKAHSRSPKDREEPQVM